jgi:hypothetical protein
VLALAGVGYAGEHDSLVILAVGLVAVVGLSQLLPALTALLLLRRDRVPTALLVSGAAAFVPGVMIVFLTVTSTSRAAALVVVAFGLVLAGLGFHQMAMRARLR